MQDTPGLDLGKMETTESSVRVTWLLAEEAGDKGGHRGIRVEVFARSQAKDNSMEHMPKAVGMV